MATKTIQDILNKKRDFLQELRDFGQEALKAEFRKFFDEHPNVVGLRWSQYTPYFNDGEPCEFAVHDFNFKFEGTPEDAEDEDGYEYVYDHSSAKSTPGQRAAKRWVRQNLESIDDEVFQASFGDHVKVTATREGFTVEEYDHE